MTGFINYVERNSAILQLLGGVVATLITVTVFAFTTFVTKEEIRKNNSDAREFGDYRLDRLEKKIDQLDDKLQRLIEGAKYEKKH